MDAKVKKRWINALRGDKYKQAQGALCIPGKKDNQDKFCCLGVLCDLYKRSKANVRKVKWTLVELDPDNRGCSFGGDTITLPYGVQKWAGLIQADPQIVIDDIREKYQSKLEESGAGDKDAIGLADLNDAGFTFKQIAKIIEEQL